MSVAPHNSVGKASEGGSPEGKLLLNYLPVYFQFSNLSVLGKPAEPEHNAVEKTPLLLAG